MHPKCCGADLGCLLIERENSDRLMRIRELLEGCGAVTLEADSAAEACEDARESLSRIRRQGGTCIVAEGRGWMIAIALAVQLNVDRIVLILPEDSGEGMAWGAEKYLRRFVHRNLFFCVSDVLFVENGKNYGGIPSIRRKMTNARIWRMLMPENAADDARFADMVVHFLVEGAYGMEMEEQI